MEEKTLASCRELIEDRDRIKTVFHFESAVIQLACAGVYVMKGAPLDVDVLKHSKTLIKDRVGVFNNFRSTGFPCIAAMLAASGKPQETLDNGLKVYGLLKEVFWTSEYLPFAAMSIAQVASPSGYETLARKTRSLYDRMKSEHWFLTSSNDSGLCALMALSDKSEDTLISNAELCYRTLKPGFFSGSAVQSLSHVLALSDTAPEEACERTMELFSKLKEAGHKYGTSYELATLGVLAMTDVDYDRVVSEMVEVDAWLAKQKGFGIMSTVSRKQRLMYAGILVQKGHSGADVLETAAISSMISLVVAQEAAMYGAICASTAAAGAAASSASN